MEADPGPFIVSPYVLAELDYLLATRRGVNAELAALADASLVILAERYSTDRLLTLDHRHFRVLRTSGGGPFVLLP